MAEKEYIERGAALKKIDTAIGEYARHGEIIRFIGDCRASVIYAPAADVVEVVRCKDCAYANENGTACHYGVGHYTSPMRYCSEGERKDGADNG